MGRSIRYWTLLAAPLLAAQAPVPRASETSWYAIAAESGERIGYASREVVDTAEGRQVTDYSQVRVRDPGDPARRITERSVTRLDRSGRVTSREGSWLAGVKGARAGIFMPAHPEVGQAFRQEFLRGHAEDHFRVLGLRASVRTPAVASTRGLLTKEWTPLEPDVVDHKLYVRGVGLVEERTIRGGDERNVLVSRS